MNWDHPETFHEVKVAIFAACMDKTGIQIDSAVSTLKEETCDHIFTCICERNLNPIFAFLINLQTKRPH